MMLSFRQKIFIGYFALFLTFIGLLFPLVSRWVHHTVMETMEERASEIINNIKETPNNDALVRRLKDQKATLFFRVGVIDNEHKILYDSHTKRLLGPKFSQEYVVSHPEVLEAFRTGTGYHEEYSSLLSQKFCYFAKAFKFHNKTYVLRAAFPHSYVTEISQDLIIGFLFLAAITLLLFSFMTWLIIHWLTRPIQTIIQAVTPYQEGRETTLPAIDVSGFGSQDDLKKLADTLNSLSAKIQSDINNLTHERNEKGAILSSLVEGVIAVDVDMHIAYANRAALNLLRKTSSEILDKHFSIIGQEKCELLLERCQKEMKPLTDTLEIYINGKKIFLDIVAAPKKLNGGAILIMHDKTTHYRLSEMQRDFTANASHELKTPITIIRGFAEVLHDNPLLPLDSRLEITNKIVHNCQRMTVLIKDLLTLADIENIPISRLTDCEVKPIVQRCFSMVSELFPDAIMTIDSPQDEDIHLIADADLLDLALMNLIENAAKYSNRPAYIHVTLSKTQNDIIIKVQDHGIGIPSADQEHIFDRFYTVDKARSRKLGGSGLGLSIVKTIVEKHAGTITLESTPGKGTTFIINLPQRNLNTEFSGDHDAPT